MIKMSKSKVLENGRPSLKMGDQARRAAESVRFNHNVMWGERPNNPTDLGLLHTGVEGKGGGVNQ